MAVAGLSHPLVVAVAGAASVDMTLRRIPLDWIARPGQDQYTPEMMQRLEDPPELGLGGNGAAAAYVLGTLGVRVHFYGPTGSDAAGWLVRGWLQEAKVKCPKPVRKATMFAVTPVDADSKRLVCWQYPTPRIDWIPSAQTEEATWLLLAAHSLVEADELEEIAEAGRRDGARHGHWLDANQSRRPDGRNLGRCRPVGWYARRIAFLVGT